MVIGERLRAIREAKHLSQGDIQKRSGLVRPYISRVECGHTVPTVETLEKLARALEVPLYELFYEGEKPPELRSLPLAKGREIAWGKSSRERRYWNQMSRLIARIKKRDQQLLLQMAQRMARR